MPSTTENPTQPGDQRKLKRLAEDGEALAKRASELRYQLAHAVGPLQTLAINAAPHMQSVATPKDVATETFLCGPALRELADDIEAFAHECAGSEALARHTETG